MFYKYFNKNKIKFRNKGEHGPTLAPASSANAHDYIDV